VAAPVRTSVGKGFCLAVLLLASKPVTAEPVRGFWLSPDWVLGTETSNLSAEGARQKTALVFDQLKELGANSLFMETYLRGYSIAPLGESGPSLPVYGITRWQGTDYLKIALEEAKKRGMKLHAWVHAFYWKTDNPALVRPHHTGATVWDDMVASYLRSGAAKLPPDQAQLVGQAADMISTGYDDLALARLLKESGVDSREGTLNALVRILRRGKVPPPAFLVSTPSGDLHPSGAQDRWMTLYLNPQHPQVLSRTLAVLSRIAHSYPDLAGIHLDHIRYPRGMLHLPPDLAGLKMGNIALGSKLYKRWKTVLKGRESAITAFVQRVRDVLPEGQKLSAAVHPMYYFSRDEKAHLITPDDFVSQDWYAWGLDLAVPMIYDADAAKIGRQLKRFKYGLANTAKAEQSRTQLVPGINVYDLIRKPALPSWVYFDFDGLRAIKDGQKPHLALNSEEPSDTMD
jgi:uncharacterized lipoprotein YddW (UPF0748 family)